MNIKESKILILGYTFKENCADERNTKVLSLINILDDYGCCVDVYDPHVKKKSFLENNPINKKNEQKYDCVIIAVSHDEFLSLSSDSIRSVLNPNGLIFDLKSIMPKGQVDFQL